MPESVVSTRLSPKQANKEKLVGFKPKGVRDPLVKSDVTIYGYPKRKGA
jgi:hypothetical protein